MKETEIITALGKHLTKAPGQGNQPFTTDAEIVEIDGRTMAFTVDEFSDEDGLSHADPGRLGENLVTATLSDLLAVGATPRFMLNALVLPPDMAPGLPEKIATGIQRGLDAFGAFMLGGDMGTAPRWRFTGVGIGTFAPGQKPLSRRISEPTGEILTTGPCGDGNLAAGLAGPEPHFECRLAAARLLKEPGLAAIDTSDGFANALATIAQLHPDLQIRIKRTNIPYAAGVQAGATTAGIPVETFFLGSAGEYELLVFAPTDEATKLVATGLFQHLGCFSKKAPGGIWLLADNGTANPLPELPDPRAAESLATYTRDLLDLAKAHFRERG